MWELRETPGHRSCYISLTSADFQHCYIAKRCKAGDILGPTRLFVNRYWYYSPLLA